MPVENIGPLTVQAIPHYRQTIPPNYVTGSFVIDDTGDHLFVADARGKGRLSVTVDIGASTQRMTTVVHGSHSTGGSTGAAGTVSIGSFGVTSSGGGVGYETVNDPFPFYLFKLTSSGTDTSETCNVYVDFSAF